MLKLSDGSIHNRVIRLMNFILARLYISIKFMDVLV